MFVSGNLVHFLDLEDRSLSYMRSSAPGGIGHATVRAPVTGVVRVHPGGQHFAVAEKGDGPRIIVYRWPERTVYRVLTGGTQREYAYVAFNASGDLLASQGGDPDFMLTVWNWETESTLLRCKAFSQDVYKVTFSPFHPGQLTSAGLGHIKLWKMAKTFTGLKLQGRLGRFGKTEISDINGFLQLPDGKVISGCEWGNILVWDDALIKVEITRRDGKPCHNGTIHKFHLEEGELISLGSDGWVRTWDFDTVDQAEASEELNGRYALDPMNELQFAAGSNLVSMWPHPDPDLESIWFMQDGNGGIWKADLSFSMTTRGPERLYECPAGPLRALVACPTGPLMAATGDDGHIAVFNYRRRELLVRSRFPAGGTTLIWLSAEVCGKTSQLLAGFADGCLRLVELHAGARKGAFGLSLVYVQKPHTAPITVMKQSPSGRMLVTASDDGTVWFFSLLIEEGQFSVAPLGFAVYGEPGETVTGLEFVPGSEVKSEILREEARLAREAEKDKQRSELQADIDERKKLGLEVDENTEKAKLEKRLALEDRELPEIPLVVPEPPSPVLVGVPAADGTFTLLMGGWDAGWVHSASFKEARPTAVRVPGAEQVGVSFRTFSADGKYMVLGLVDGRIRIHAVHEDPWALDDYWHLHMHDNTFGRITGICFSYDGRTSSVACDSRTPFAPRPSVPVFALRAALLEFAAASWSSHRDNV
ncbi:Cilia- and flagella-associated protein 44 [Amphibalanus amphitrite]|uniref:Cilia-and flagella-associated protein 44 n=1 Tax=Amphibalanus amphitrite TaxID=1232801 RepID=A0A6A4VNS2_AMPAM|nr:Cilia- and flagella-associated protein 44 [Amphibalanus amphitrite]